MTQEYKVINNSYDYLIVKEGVIFCICPTREKAILVAAALNGCPQSDIKIIEE